VGRSVRHARLCFLEHKGKALVLVFALLLSLLFTACSQNPYTASQVTLRVAAHPSMKGLHQAVMPKFARQWRLDHDQNVVFDVTYGPSSLLADQIISGQNKADVADLSTPLEVYRLVDAQMVDREWEQRLPRGGIVAESFVVFLTRPGNPKNIKSWSDLARQDVKVVAANPKTSGMGLWQFLSLWGSVIESSGDAGPKEAEQFVKTVYQHSLSGMDSLFAGQKNAEKYFLHDQRGDVLLASNSSAAVELRSDSRHYEVVTPALTMSIQEPVTVVDKNIDQHAVREVGEAYVNFLYSDDIQREYMKYGFLSVNPYLQYEQKNQVDRVQKLFNASDLGGWSFIRNSFFAKKSVIDQVLRQVS
jgi:sulfate/thiosulfate-binding protein